MSANDGGPAFPAEEWIDSVDPSIVNPIRHKGMTLRDYFAAKWMQGFVANSGVPDMAPEDASRYAYKIADYMLKARES